MTDEGLTAERYNQLVEFVESRTGNMGGGHEKTAEYQQLLAEGAAVFPFLIEDLRQGYSNWRMCMASDLSQVALGGRIVVERSEITDSDSAAKKVVAWWDQTGQAIYELHQSIN